LISTKKERELMRGKVKELMRKEREIESVMRGYGRKIDELLGEKT
jgi:hypothetical protein